MNTVTVLRDVANYKPLQRSFLISSTVLWCDLKVIGKIIRRNLRKAREYLLFNKFGMTKMKRKKNPNQKSFLNH